MGAELYSAVPSTNKALLLLASWRLSFKAWWRLCLPRAQLSCAFILDVCTPVSLLGCRLPGFSPQFPHFSLQSLAWCQRSQRKLLNKWICELVITSYNHQSAPPQPNICLPVRASHLYKTISGPPTHSQTAHFITGCTATVLPSSHLVAKEHL